MFKEKAIHLFWEWKVYIYCNSFILLEVLKHFSLYIPDIDQLPDPTVFDNLPDEFPSEPFLTSISLKEEAKSPASCDSQSVYSYSSASPPHSPSISEAGSSMYSTDEGIQSDFSDFEGWLKNLPMLYSFLNLFNHLLNKLK